MLTGSVGHDGMGSTELCSRMIWDRTADGAVYRIMDADCVLSWTHAVFWAPLGPGSRRRSLRFVPHSLSLLRHARVLNVVSIRHEQRRGQPTMLGTLCAVRNEPPDT